MVSRMTRGGWKLLGLCGVLVVAVVLVAGCPSQAPPEEETVVMQPPAEPAPVDEPVAEEPGVEEPEEPAAAPGEFEYTQAPSVEDIPAGPVSGLLHNQAFTAQTIRIEKKDEGTFQMQISNGELTIPDSVTSTINDDDGWRFRFTVPEGSTTTREWAIDDEKTFDDEHAYYYYDQGEDRPAMSVNGPWGAALEITEWTEEEPGDSGRVIGTMKGRVALVMRDTDRSWAAGEFEAPVFEW